MGVTWKALLLNITGLLVVLQEALGQPQSYPHPEFVVPALWTLTGFLGVLIMVMVRLWYRDFCGWRDQMTKDIGGLKADIASQGTAIDTVTNEFRSRLNTLETNLHEHEQNDVPKSKRRKL